MAMANTAKYKNKLSPSFDGLRSGGLHKKCFSYWKAFSHSSVLANACFRVLKKGRPLSVALKTN